MHSILLRVSEPEDHLLLAELWDRGTLGIIDEPEGIRAFFDDSADLASVLEHFASRTLESRVELPQVPIAADEMNGDALLLGSRFWIAPAAFAGTAPDHRTRIELDTTLAFGSGRHESTQLVIEALERHLSLHQTILDIGSGSGILSHAATLLGAVRVFACDIHPNCARPGNSPLPYSFFLGSADTIRTQTGDLVLANISARVIDALAGELKRITKPGGRLILAGFIEGHVPQFFTPQEVTTKNEWLCWTCSPESISLPDSAPTPLSHPVNWW